MSQSESQESGQSRTKTYVLKICLLGDGAVGKTSLRTRYLGEGFTTNYSETIGADFALKFAKIDGNSFKFQIWDIAGQKRYSNVRVLLFERSDGGLLLYDISSRESMKNVRNWLETYVKYAGVGVVILIGNKSDLRNENHSNLDLISKEEGEELAKQLSEEFNKNIQYVETSAKTGENVDYVFELLAREYLKAVSS